MGTQSYTSLNEPNEMVVANYQQAIIDSLLESIPTNVIPDTLHIVPVFDLQSNRYQLLCQGWTSGEKRVFHPVIHIENIISREILLIIHHTSLLSRGFNLQSLLPTFRHIHLRLFSFPWRIALTCSKKYPLKIFRVRSSTRRKKLVRFLFFSFFFIYLLDFYSLPGYTNYITEFWGVSQVPCTH